jgi:hypothetical protein
LTGRLPYNVVTPRGACFVADLHRDFLVMAIAASPLRTRALMLTLLLP